GCAHPLVGHARVLGPVPARAALRVRRRLPDPDAAGAAGRRAARWSGGTGGLGTPRAGHRPLRLDPGSAPLQRGRRMNRRTVRVTVVVWVKLIRQAVMRDLQFRSQAWLHLVASVGELVVGVLPVLILTSYTGSDPAISQASVLTVGVFAITTGLMDCFV